MHNMSDDKGNLLVSLVPLKEMADRDEEEKCDQSLVTLLVNNGFTIIHSLSQLRYQIRVLVVLQNTNLIVK